ncbi:MULTISPECIES: hypothetical protein [Arthrobacter]|uniref:DUF4926 domain-containing protein n=1 Tax=Arthrobacter terricola TaxID=2547396 RepID=A0A4R5KE36_9MICC|nr:MULTISPECIES: hypothetical protein [Arthrobacter]MBT8162703.1 hypothetical protein [Arthrobacter sp. GN70]TDF92477.1 hypothetical protein E1809_18260 [Arthrobacter terricola]
MKMRQSGPASSQVSEWTSLQRGDIVTLLRHGVQCHMGTIDERTEDGRMIWVTDAIGDRRLFHIEDDYELLVMTLSAPAREALAAAGRAGHPGAFNREV